jgi:predicted DNA-binding WGR domain protein
MMTIKKKAQSESIPTPANLERVITPATIVVDKDPQETVPAPGSDAAPSVETATAPDAVEAKIVANKPRQQVVSRHADRLLELGTKRLAQEEEKAAQHDEIEAAKEDEKKAAAWDMGFNAGTAGRDPILARREAGVPQPLFTVFHEGFKAGHQVFALDSRTAQSQENSPAMDSAINLPPPSGNEPGSPTAPAVKTISEDTPKESIPVKVGQEQTSPAMDSAINLSPPSGNEPGNPTAPAVKTISEDTPTESIPIHKIGDDEVDMGAALLEAPEKEAQAEQHPDDGKEIEIAPNVYAMVETYHEYGAPAGSPYRASWSVGGENVDPKSGKSAEASSKMKAYEYGLADAKRAAGVPKEGQQTFKLADPYGWLYEKITKEDGVEPSDDMMDAAWRDYLEEHPEYRMEDAEAKMARKAHAFGKKSQVSGNDTPGTRSPDNPGERPLSSEAIEGTGMPDAKVAQGDDFCGRYEYSLEGENSNKFYEVTKLSEDEYELRWGRIGTEGQSQIVDADKAEKKAMEKIRKGYSKVGSKQAADFEGKVWASLPDSLKKESNGDKLVAVYNPKVGKAEFKAIRTLTSDHVAHILAKGASRSKLGESKAAKAAGSKTAQSKSVVIDFTNLEEADNGDTTTYGGSITIDGVEVQAAGSDRSGGPHEDAVIDALEAKFGMTHGPELWSEIWNLNDGYVTTVTQIGENKFEISNKDNGRIEVTARKKASARPFFVYKVTGPLGEDDQSFSQIEKSLTPMGQMELDLDDPKSMLAALGVPNTESPVMVDDLAWGFAISLFKEPAFVLTFTEKAAKTAQELMSKIEQNASGMWDIRLPGGDLLNGGPWKSEDEAINVARGYEARIYAAKQAQEKPRWQHNTGSGIFGDADWVAMGKDFLLSITQLDSGDYMWQCSFWAGGDAFNSPELLPELKEGVANSDVTAKMLAEESLSDFRQELPKEAKTAQKSTGYGIDLSQLEGEDKGLAEQLLKDGGGQVVIRGEATDSEGKPMPDHSLVSDSEGSGVFMAIPTSALKKTAQEIKMDWQSYQGDPDQTVVGQDFVLTVADLTNHGGAGDQSFLWEIQIWANGDASQGMPDVHEQGYAMTMTQAKATAESMYRLEKHDLKQGKQAQEYSKPKDSAHNLNEVKALIKEAYGRGEEMLYNGTKWMKHDSDEVLCISHIDDVDFKLDISSDGSTLTIEVMDREGASMVEAVNA